jgi:uncharacterized protein YcbX
MHVSGLFIYPVKSLRGRAVTQVDVDSLGFVGDRRFMVVDGNSQFLTQRTLPRMALIQTRLDSGTLVVSATGAADLRVEPVVKEPALIRYVSVWRSAGLQAEDCGNAAADWLEDILGLECRLVRTGPRFHRPIPASACGATDDVLGFPDSSPILAISESSLANLNDRLVSRGEDPLPIDRFRPNLVIADCAAFAEDSWSRIRIAGVVFRSAGPCARCVVTTTDQQTAARGQNLIHETKSGMLGLGAPVEVIG